MNPGRRKWLVVGGVAVSAATAGAGLAWYRRSSGGQGQALRTARFVDLQGNSRGLNEWSGKVLLINFWATWCAPCLEEIPMLGELRRVHQPKGFEVVGIAIDQASKVGEFQKKLSIEYPLLVADASGLQLLRQLGNPSGGLSFTLLLDRNHQPSGHKLGALKRPEAEAMVTRAMSG